MSVHPFPEALKRFDGDEELLQSMAVMIAEDVPSEVRKLDRFLAAEDAKNSAASAHTLKGMLATFEEGPAVNGLQQVETLSLAGDLDSAKTRFDAARESIDTLMKTLRGIAEAHVIAARTESD